MRTTILLLLVLLVSIGPRAGHAQNEAPEAYSLRHIASFEDARAVAADARGRLYVVDAGQNVVVQLTAEGDVLRTLGGSGTAPGALYDPRDVDPTNGLVLVVADAGNGRIQRFSRQFVPLEVLPVVRIDRYVPEQAGQPIYSLGERGEVGTPDGRPIAVVTSEADETFAIDAAQGLVLKWDRQRRLEQAIGGYDTGPGALIDPVGLAIDERYLYVADRGEGGIAVYDHLGAFVRWIGRGALPGVQAVTVVEGVLWIVLPDQLLTYTRSGRRAQEHRVDVAEELIDVAVLRSQVYVLTPRSLGVLSE